MSFLPWAGGLFLAIINTLIWQAYSKEENLKLQFILESESLRIQEEISSKLKTKLLALNRMSDRWNVRGGMPERIWEEDAKAYIEDDPGYQAIEWVDKTFHVRWIVPLKGNEKAQNLNLGFEKNRRLALEKSKKQNKITITKNINLVQGGKGFLVFNPLYVNDEFQGFILGVFKYKQLFDSFLEDTYKNQFDISLQEKDQILYEYRNKNSNSNTELIQFQKINLFETVWDLKVLPTKSYVDKFRSPLFFPGVSTGFLLSILFALSLYFAQKFYFNKQVLEYLNQELEIKNEKANKSLEFALEAEISAKKATEIAQEKSQQFDELRKSALNIAQDAEKLAQEKNILTERQELALEASGVGIWDWDVVNNVLVWDEQMYQLYGIHSENFSGAYEAWQHGVHPDDLTRGDQEIQQALSGEKKFDTEFRVVWPNGAVRNIRALATVIRDNNDRPLRMLGANWDITSQKDLENKLIQSNEELEKFAYVSSHDLKAPLRAINELSKWIEEDSGDSLSEQSHKDLKLLRQRVKRMQHLIDDLLQYARLDSKKHEKSLVDVKTLLENIIDLIEIPEGFSITIDNMPKFETANSPLQQTFLNLIGNAIKHHHDLKNGKIKISCSDLSQFYEFSVTDNGPGIDPEKHKKVFEMFATLRPRDEIEGSGMGLAFVDKILRNIGGNIHLESKQGQGAKFIFQWPKKITS